VHVLGARFETTQEALTALQELRARFALADIDADVRPLGSTRYEAPTSGLILAARFRPELVADVIAILEDFGGTVVVEHSDMPGPSASSDWPPSRDRLIRQRVDWRPNSSRNLRRT